MRREDGQRDSDMLSGCLLVAFVSAGLLVVAYNGGKTLQRVTAIETKYVPSANARMLELESRLTALEAQANKEAK